MQRKKHLERLNIIVGNKPYAEKNLICGTSKLRNKSCYQFYKYFNTVAFVVNEIHPYKISFENILHLINYHHNFNIRKKYKAIATSKNWVTFVEEMYTNHGIVFINQNEIKVNSLNHSKVQFLKNSNSILTCGKPAKKELKKYIKNMDFKMLFIMHVTQRLSLNLSQVKNT